MTHLTSTTSIEALAERNERSDSQNKAVAQLDVSDKWEFRQNTDGTVILVSKSDERLFLSRSGSHIFVTYKPRPYDKTRLDNSSDRNMCDSWDEAVSVANAHLN